MSFSVEQMVTLIAAMATPLAGLVLWLLNRQSRTVSTMKEAVEGSAKAFETLEKSAQFYQQEAKNLRAEMIEMRQSVAMERAQNARIQGQIQGAFAVQRRNIEAELERLRVQVRDLTAENHQLKAQLQIVTQELSLYKSQSVRQSILQGDR